MNIGLDVYIPFRALHVLITPSQQNRGSQTEGQRKLGSFFVSSYSVLIEIYTYFEMDTT
jgi:hypothetical protein